MSSSVVVRVLWFDPKLYNRTPKLLYEDQHKIYIYKDLENQPFSKPCGALGK